MLIFGLWEYSRYAYFWSLGVLPVCLFWVSGSTPSMLFLPLGVSIPGVLPETKNKIIGSSITTHLLC